MALIAMSCTIVTVMVKWEDYRTKIAGKFKVYMIELVKTEQEPWRMKAKSLFSLILLQTQFP